MIGMGIPVMEVYCGNMERKAAFGLAQMEYGLPPSQEVSRTFLDVVHERWATQHHARATWTKPLRKRRGAKVGISPEFRVFLEAFMKNTEHIVD